MTRKSLDFRKWGNIMALCTDWCKRESLSFRNYDATAENEVKKKFGYICGHSWDEELENTGVHIVVVYPTLERIKKDHATPGCSIVRVAVIPVD